MLSLLFAYTNVWQFSTWVQKSLLSEAYLTNSAMRTGCRVEQGVPLHVTVVSGSGPIQLWRSAVVLPRAR
jgi:hypothetical protein